MINYTIGLLEFEKALLVLMRLASFIMVAPIFGQANVPMRVKAGFAFFMTLIIYSTSADLSVEYNGILEYAVLVIKECIVGLILGYTTNMCMQAIHFAGRIIDMDIGLAMANVMDPTSREQVGIIGSLYYDLVMLLMFVTDMHTYIIRAIIETYQVIPLGKMTINASLYDTVVGFIGDYFVIGFRIALPVFATILLLNAILAILVKVAPQMNMFVIGMQLKILFGLGALFVTVWLLPSIATFVSEQMKMIFKELVTGMQPM